MRTTQKQAQPAADDQRYSDPEDSSTRPLISSTGRQKPVQPLLVGTSRRWCSERAPGSINMEADATGKGVEETKRVELIGQ